VRVVFLARSGRNDTHSVDAFDRSPGPHVGKARAVVEATRNTPSRSARASAEARRATRAGDPTSAPRNATPAGAAGAARSASGTAETGQATLRGRAARTFAALTRHTGVVRVRRPASLAGIFVATARPKQAEKSEDPERHHAFHADKVTPSGPRTSSTFSVERSSFKVRTRTAVPSIRPRPSRGRRSCRPAF
jgi:hypothetical protein